MYVWMYIQKGFFKKNVQELKGSAQSECHERASLWIKPLRDHISVFFPVNGAFSWLRCPNSVHVTRRTICSRTRHWNNNLIFTGHYRSASRRKVFRKSQIRSDLPLLLRSITTRPHILKTLHWQCNISFSFFSVFLFFTYSYLSFVSFQYLWGTFFSHNQLWIWS